MIGRTIGHYRVVGQLGRGGSGTVYEAIDETLHREVAIKVVNPDAADPDAMTRFRAEATILAQLNHPDIATIYELFQSEADLLMVMEFVCGETLDALSAREGRLPPNRAAYLVERILSALQHAHRAGVVHRDMKPANVMVTSAGTVKLMDFGIARFRGAERITIDGSMIGTPAYMAPEQVLGQEVDGRSDLYAVGVIFYRLLTAALPFTGDTPVAMLQHQLADAPIPLGARRDDLPDWCDTIVQRALAKAPADRFQTAEEFRQCLTRAAGIVTTTDLANAFAAADRTDVRTPRPPIPAPTVVMPVGETDLPTASEPSQEATALADGPAPTIIRPTSFLQRNTHVVTAVGLVALAAALFTAFTALERRPETETARSRTGTTRRATAPDSSARIDFETRTLVGNGRKQREREARLVLSDGTITVLTEDERRPVHSVPYERVTSITYSHGRDPMWRSPTGPALVARADGGILRALRVPVTRHWISLATTTPDRFVVVDVNESQVRSVLTALEARTGLEAQLIGARERGDER